MPGSEGAAPPGLTFVLDKPDLSRIIDRLWQEGYTVVGPTIAQGAIIFDEVRRLEQLPIGWTDEQEGGTIGSSRAMTAPISATLSARIRGRSIFSPRD